MKRIFYSCFLLLFFLAGKINAQCWSKVSAGNDHTLAIKSDGTLWAWGENSGGTLGDSTLVNKNTPVQIGTSNDWSEISAGNYTSFAIKTNGTLWGWGVNWGGQLGDSTTIDKIYPVQIGTANNWIRISSGSWGSCAIRSDGTLWAWGASIGLFPYKLVQLTTGVRSVLGTIMPLH